MENRWKKNQNYNNEISPKRRAHRHPSRLPLANRWISPRISAESFVVRVPQVNRQSIESHNYVCRSNVKSTENLWTSAETDEQSMDNGKNFMCYRMWTGRKSMDDLCESWEYMWRHTQCNMVDNRSKFNWEVIEIHSSTNEMSIANLWTIRNTKCKSIDNLTNIDGAVMRFNGKSMESQGNSVQSKWRIGFKSDWKHSVSSLQACRLDRR